MVKKLLFSVTADDCDWQTLKGSGPGGQHRNVTETGVRCTHRASGATATALDSKSQRRNKEAAFVRMCNTKRFKDWHRLETARRLANERSIEDLVNRKVDEALQPQNVKMEVQDERGRWIPAEK